MLVGQKRLIPRSLRAIDKSERKQFQAIKPLNWHPFRKFPPRHSTITMAFEFQMIFVPFLSSSAWHKVAIVAVCAIICVTLYPLSKRLEAIWVHRPQKITSSQSAKKPKEPHSTLKRTAAESSFRDLDFYKDLYFRLQNLESHPEVFQIARQSLLCLFSEALTDYTKSHTGTILEITHFDRNALADFLGTHHKKVTAQYQEYIEQRNLGGPRQLVRDRQDAEAWLRKIAPLKLVDGAWLGHLNKITIPFALRSIMKKAWQVFTEELGDGNYQQHHVYLYERLLREFEPKLPSPTTRDILHPRYKFDSLKSWRAGVTQLMISLFPEEFFPEILGYNMHFEMLQLDTMQAARELPEVSLDPYYFLLHVSIDNSHSGHAAMSMECCSSYIEHILETGGEEAAHIAWKRIQTGYILSEWVGSKGDEATDIPLQLNSVPCDQLEPQIIAIFRNKVQAAEGIHCACKVKIGNRPLNDWLNPKEFVDENWQKDFLRCLSETKPWIYPGNSKKSRLVRELHWGGKMFGSFTRDELRTLEHWIESLKPHRIPFYYDFVGLTLPSRCQGCSYSNEPASILTSPNQPTFSSTVDASLPLLSHSLLMSKVKSGSVHFNLPSLLPLWFTQCCLLESFVYAPARTSDGVGCAVVRLLRAQLGFDTEGTMVTGLDEPHAEEGSGSGIVGMGLEMIQRASLPVPPDLKTLLECWPSNFAEKMLQLASQPLKNFDFLVGIAMALLELQELVSEAPGSTLLSFQSRNSLHVLVRRQYHCLQDCQQHIFADEKRFTEYSRGYAIGSQEMIGCVTI